MRGVETIYVKGLWYIVATVGSVIVYNLMCIVTASRIGTFIENHISSKNHISMADTIGHVYGNIPRIITALASVGAAIPVIAGQITVTSRILQTCISDINPTTLMVISASIVILYSMFGGIQSVTITDILQCATFTIMLPYVAYKVLHHTGMTIPEIFKTVSQSEKFQLKPILQNKTQLLSLIALSMTGFGIGSPSVQRMYMAKNSRQAREAYVISAILRIGVKLTIVFIGIAIYIGYSDLASPRMIWPAIMSDSSAIFKGFFVISLFAMAMSTADSCLNVASSMIAYDIVNPLRKHKLTDKQQLYLAKTACLIVGVFSISLALSASKYKDALLRLPLLAKGISNPTFVAPFLLAVFGFRCKESIAVLGMMVGIITITLWRKLMPSIDGSFVAMLANGITMILAHYSLPKNDRQDWAKPSLDYQQLQQSRQRRCTYKISK